MKMKDETGYVLISEIIKAHTAEHNKDSEIMERCNQALMILDMYKQNDKLNEKAQYKQVSEEQNNRIQEIRELFSEAYDYIDKNCKKGRETSLAITKLEEAQFWAIKGITRESEGEE